MPAADDKASGQGRSWRSTLGVESQADAAARLQALGYDFSWCQGGALQVTTPILPAIRTLADGRRVFFNQLIAAFKGWNDDRNTASRSVQFGDGTPMDTEGLHTACRLAEQLTFDLAWEAGDVALLDNFLVMHGRRPYRGQRRVLASLVANDC